MTGWPGAIEVDLGERVDDDCPLARPVLRSSLSTESGRLGRTGAIWRPRGSAVSSLDLSISKGDPNRCIFRSLRFEPSRFPS